MTIPTLKEILSGIKVSRKDVLAQALASWTYNTLSDKTFQPALESEFIASKLADTPAYARKAIELALHGLSGVAHSVQFSDGPISGFSATVLGSMFSEIAARVTKEKGRPTIIDVTPQWYQDAEVREEFDPEVRALAARDLAWRFDEARRANPSDVKASRIREFLRKVKDALATEREGILDLLDDVNQHISDKRKDLKRKGRSS